MTANGITLRYPGAARPVLAGFALALGRGEVVSLLGPSGVGKSSLLRALGGLQSLDKGEVLLNGEAVQQGHPRVAFGFQNAALLPWLTLEANVAFGLDFKRQEPSSAAERKRRVDRAITEVGLDHARKLRPASLSGGMAQRAALARCLARRPEVLLLDEPFGALDEVTRADMQALLLKVVADLATAVVLVTHDIDEALLVSDRVLLLGGAPAGVVGAWELARPKPRHDALDELDAVRVDILRHMRGHRPF